jgi:hypothetical protein
MNDYFSKEISKYAEKLNNRYRSKKISQEKYLRLWTKLEEWYEVR